MKRNYFRLFVVLFAAVALAAAARANELDRMVVNIPYDFVANGRTLPAGTYIVQRLSDVDEFSLAISSFENHSTVYVLSNEVESTSHARPHVTFQQASGQRFLTKIETGEHVFSIPLSETAVERAAQNNSGGYVTGTSEISKQ
jgi:hypothetical protein